MGKLIICQGKIAEKPYYMKLSNRNIYSIEELCYYIHVNLDMLDEEMFTESLANFIKDDLELKNSGEKLSELIKSKASLKDIIVCILCSCDYFTEAEIKQIIKKLDINSNLSPFEKRKRRGDQYLYLKKYEKARGEYEKILYGKETFSISNAQYGSILHNLGIIKLNTEGIMASLSDFREAYNRSNNYDSLKLYILGLKMTNQKEEIDQAMTQYKIKQEAIEDMLLELELDERNLNTSNQSFEDYASLVKEIITHKEEGKITEFYKKAEMLLKLIKDEYRLENA